MLHLQTPATWAAIDAAVRRSRALPKWLRDSAGMGYPIDPDLARMLRTDPTYFRGIPVTRALREQGARVAVFVGCMHRVIAGMDDHRLPNANGGRFTAAYRSALQWIGLLPFPGTDNDQLFRQAAERSFAHNRRLELDGAFDQDQDQ